MINETTLRDMALEILRLTMEEEIRWSLPEVDVYRKELDTINSIAKSPLNYRSTQHKRIAMKRAKLLRSKIRNLNWENAKRFVSWTSFQTGPVGWNMRQTEYMVEVEIREEKVNLHFYEKVRTWEDYGIDRGFKLKTPITVSSDEVSEIAMFPAFLRTKEAVKLHKESKHADKDS